MRTRSLLLPLLLLIVVVISTAPPLVTQAAAAACHLAPSCPDPKVCGPWSSMVSCDSPFCDTHPACDFINGGPAIVQLKERFRVCTIADGSQCLDWELYSFKVRCGC